MASSVIEEELQRFREQWLQEVRSSINEEDDQQNENKSEDTKLLSETLNTLTLNQDLRRQDEAPEEHDPLVIQFSLQENNESVNGSNETTQEKLSYISLLPVEILMKIFQGFDAKTLEKCSIVSKTWFIVARSGILWRPLCCKEFADCKGFRRMYNNNWRFMYINRPRLLYNGLYISKSEYIRPGLTEGVYVNPVHRVVYFRYLRFYPEGKLVYYLGSEMPKEFAEWFKPEHRHKLSDKVCNGFFTKDEQLIHIWYKGAQKATFNTQLELYSTVAGKNNRLALKECRSFNVGGDGRYDYYMEVPSYQFIKLPAHLL